jgi:hypothetical protein
MNSTAQPRDTISSAIRQAAAQGRPAVVGFMTGGFPDRAGFRDNLLAIGGRPPTSSRSACRSPIRWRTE